MRFGVSTWVWSFPFDPAHDHELVDRVVALGGDHVELGGEAVGSPALQPLRDAIARTGVTASICGIFGPDRDLSRDDATRDAGLAYVEACVATAGEIGAATVIGAMCGTGGVELLERPERRRRVDRAREALAAAAQLARRGGVRLGLEGLNRYENNLVTTVDDGLELVDAVGDDALGIHVDLFHAAMEETSLRDALARTEGRLVSVHATDSHRGAPGSALTDWEAVRAGLADARFDGPLVIESHTPYSAELAPLSAIRRPLAPTQDDLARDGIAFLRSLCGA
jgi:D-psicose/D-tagatose/L-ribulose 3-epimerase